jgi:hypothetical protein
LAIQVFGHRFRYFKPVEASFNLIYVISQSIISFDYYEALVGSLYS